MTQDPAQSSFEHDLKALERQIDELIELSQRLKTENQNLRKEHAELARKNELARSQIESMVMRLKSMEREYDQ